MSYYTGKQGKGAAKARKGVLRAEAEDRQALTPDHRRKAFRLGPVPSDGVRTPRSIRAYRTAFLGEHGVTPEIYADDIENPNGPVDATL